MRELKSRALELKSRAPEHKSRALEHKSRAPEHIHTNVAVGLQGLMGIDGVYWTKIVNETLT